ncbi:MAG: zf-HC2 domain-containing protein [Clostridia bacterium]|nr:zf-HC2 domain-containing protein [Clostridia bacterium]MBQ7296660.1 zf-HC2 domain-containing protein [Clostridia bacterium]
MNKCNIIKDLLPLYADEVCSEDSKEMVEEHIASCKDCSQELEDYRYNTGLPEVSADKAMKNFKKKMNKKNLKKVLISVVVCLTVILGGTYLLFVPEFAVPYSEDLMTVKIPEDGGFDVWVNLPNFTQVYSVVEYNDEDEAEIYLTVTRNLWSMIAKDSDKANNFWRTNGFIGVSYQASDDMPFKESDTAYLYAGNEIVSIHYAEYESSHITNRKADFKHAVYNGKAKTHLIWSASESE